MCFCTHMGGLQLNLWCFSIVLLLNSYLINFFRWSLSLSWSFSSRLGLLDSESWGSSWLHLPSMRIPRAFHHLWIVMWCVCVYASLCAYSHFVGCLWESKTVEAERIQFPCLPCCSSYILYFNIIAQARNINSIQNLNLKTFSSTAYKILLKCFP